MEYDDDESVYCMYVEMAPVHTIKYYFGNENMRKTLLVMNFHFCFGYKFIMDR